MILVKERQKRKVLNEINLVFYFFNLKKIVTIMEEYGLCHITFTSHMFLESSYIRFVVFLILL